MRGEVPRGFDSPLNLVQSMTLWTVFGRDPSIAQPREGSF
jgi:hypothetical protein